MITRVAMRVAVIDSVNYIIDSLVSYNSAFDCVPWKTIINYFKKLKGFLSFKIIKCDILNN